MPAPPPPPWRTRADAVVWWHGATVAAFVTYRESPVGPYREVLASSPLGTVPFIAVDSLESLVGGRVNWDLPKELAAFRGLCAWGDGWTVEADVRLRPRGLRVPLLGLVRQPRARQRFAGRGTAHPATVEVRPRGRSELRPGRHRGMVVRDARVTFRS